MHIHVALISVPSLHINNPIVMHSARFLFSSSPILKELCTKIDGRVLDGATEGVSVCVPTANHLYAATCTLKLL